MENRKMAWASQSGYGAGHIYVQSGEYYLSPSFPGFNIHSFTRLTLDPTALLNVYYNYGGYVFKLQSTNNEEPYHSIIDGGIISEKSPPGDPNRGNPPQRKWVGIQLQGSAGGVFFNNFLNMRINDANIGIRFLVDTAAGWINANSFKSIKMWNNNVFIDFDATGVGRGIDRNYFENLECQCARNSSFGVRGIKGECNTFIDVNIWDLPTGSTNATIDNSALNTIIIGGIMTGQGFIDRGRYTKIFDQWQGFKFGNDIDRGISTMKLGVSSVDRIGFFGSQPVSQQPGGTQPDLTTVWNALKAYGLLG
jgi:hypothetical protein